MQCKFSLPKKKKNLKISFFFQSACTLCTLVMEYDFKVDFKNIFFIFLPCH